MAETSQQAQSPEQLEGRRHEYRLLGNVRDAKIIGDTDEAAVKARRMAFSRRSMEIFGAVLIGRPTTRFRVWLYPESLPLRPESRLEFADDDAWRIVGVVDRVIDGELVSHEVMAARYGD